MDDTCCCCNHKHPVKFFRTNSWQQAAMSSHDTGRFNHRTQRYISGSYDVGPECFPIFHGLSCILNPPPYFMGWCFHRKHVMRTSYIPSWPNHWWTCHHRAFVINKTPKPSCTKHLEPSNHHQSDWVSKPSAEDMPGYAWPQANALPGMWQPTYRCCSYSEDPLL